METVKSRNGRENELGRGYDGNRIGVQSERLPAITFCLRHSGSNRFPSSAWSRDQRGQQTRWMMNYHTGFSDTAMDGEEVAYSPTGAGLEDSEVERKRRFKWA
jgi:hypothetical protein